MAVIRHKTRVSTFTFSLSLSLNLSLHLSFISSISFLLLKVVTASSVLLSFLAFYTEINELIRTFNCSKLYEFNDQ